MIVVPHFRPRISTWPVLLDPKEGLQLGFTRSREGTSIGFEEGGIEGTVSEQCKLVLADTGVEGNIGVDEDGGDVDDHVR